MADSGIDVVQLAAALHSLSEFAEEHAPAQRSPVLDVGEEHLGTDPTVLGVVSDEHPIVERPNLQLALDAWAAVDGNELVLLGLVVPNRGAMETSLPELLVANRWSIPDFGPISYVEVPAGVGASLTCVANALLLLRSGGVPVLGLLSQTPDMGMTPPRIRVEVMASDQAVAVQLLADLRRLVTEHSVYRGQVISMAATDERHPFGGQVGVAFYTREPIDRDALVLAPGVLERVERHTLRFSERADELRRRGQDLKRGLLLFGPPGTGKTLTVRYLTAAQPDRTVVLVPGANVTVLDAACSVARRLTPSTVVLEDVDLVAEERTLFGHGQNPMLAALLNEMDNAGADRDLVFILTTNRPDLLEPALASRPGRIDQAIAVELPDAECRRRLLDLYGEQIVMTATEIEALVERLDGVSAAFVKELARRAVLLATLEDTTPAGRHATAALDELFGDSEALTRSLLGAVPPLLMDDDDTFPLPPGLTVPAEVRRMMQLGTDGD